MVICLEQCLNLGYLWVDSKSCPLARAYPMAVLMLKVLHGLFHITLTTNLCKCLLSSHFTDEETGTGKLTNLSQVSTASKWQS